ncbi:hypothetical protein OS21_36180 [Dickeya oryzae]
MGVMKTPGVYIVEKNAFPNSVVEVATAVPAFIGYTEKAENGGVSLRNKAWRITSMSDFRHYFGGAPLHKFDIVEKTDQVPGDAAFSQAGKAYTLTLANTRYLLYYSMLFFFQNGGGPCYIISVGSYQDAIDADALKKRHYTTAQRAGTHHGADPGSGMPERRRLHQRAAGRAGPLWRYHEKPHRHS